MCLKPDGCIRDTRDYWFRTRSPYIQLGMVFFMLIICSRGYQLRLGEGRGAQAPWWKCECVCELGYVRVPTLLVFNRFNPLYPTSCSSFYSPRGNYSGKGRMGIKNVVTVSKFSWWLLICSRTTAWKTVINNGHRWSFITYLSSVKNNPTSR
jgi:hypothetical protein